MVAAVATISVFAFFPSLLEFPPVAGHNRVRLGVNLLAVAYLWAGVWPLMSLVQRNHTGGRHRFAPETSTLALALVAVELLIVMVPLRRGEKWAYWAALIPLVLVALPRMLTDPNCTAMSLSVHGCHQFMGALLVAAVGFIMAFPGLRHDSAQQQH